MGTRVHTTATVVAYAAAAFVLGYLFPRRQPTTPPPEQSFLLLVQLEFKTVEDRMAAEDAWRPEADHCRAAEPGTLSYELARSDKNDRMIIIIERYADKDQAYLDVHKKSAAFARFRPQLAALDPKIVGESYVASDLGYMSRAEL